MSKLIIMSGLPASGKSTKAKEIMDASGNTVRINKDLLRTMLHFDKFDYNNEEATRLAAQTLARLFLSKGKTVIIDDTNLNEKTMQSWKSLAKDAGSRIQYEDMDTSLNECLLRDMKREKPVGDTVIVGMALSSGKYPKPDLPVVLCDIDGTLANIDHRLHYVKKRCDDCGGNGRDGENCTAGGGHEKKDMLMGLTNYLSSCQKI